MADEKVTVRLQHIVKPRHQRVAGRLVEVNHHITAEDHIEFPPEMHRLHQVKGPENHIIPQGLGHLILAGRSILCEVPAHPGLRHVGWHVIKPDLRLLHSLMGDVRGQDTGVPCPLSAEKFLEIDGQRIGLFTAGTTGTPDGDAALPLPGHSQLGQDGVGKIGEMILFPEKNTCNWWSVLLSTNSKSSWDFVWNRCSRNGFILV